jgi:hypothetical protein
VRMQPQTKNAATIAQKIQSCICCTVVFSVERRALASSGLLAREAATLLSLRPFSEAPPSPASHLTALLRSSRTQHHARASPLSA